MPTGNRVEFALQAIRLFWAQDYEERELIIIDDGHDDLRAQLPVHERIVYARAPAGTSIGVKRNLACELAGGRFIAQWDDDDWYGVSRLSAQLAPLLRGQADVTGLGETIFFNIRTWRFWRPTPSRHLTMFADDVHSGTLTFRREVWEQLARYPDRSLQEDAQFQREATQRGARLERVICDPPVFMYVRHGSNAWAVRSLREDGGEDWVEINEPALFSPEDRVFYRSQLHRVASR
jgi:glycosyltransferase involved in cell wall biosynthesis